MSGVLKGWTVLSTNHKPSIPQKQRAKQEIDRVLRDITKSSTERALDVALYIMHEQLFWDGNKRTANLK